eukprot:1208597-Amphidinium_carterae.1
MPPHRWADVGGMQAAKEALLGAPVVEPYAALQIRAIMMHISTFEGSRLEAARMLVEQVLQTCLTSEKQLHMERLKLRTLT